MDQYQVLEELAPGAFGTMFIVDDYMGDSKKFALKKVECVDEGEANRALKEAILLLQLQHSNICAYKECFITWDNQISSLFLCLVMEHLHHGDLAALIRAKRQNQEKIEEMVVQGLLGQAVDALVHIHKQNIIHRNLKPSNILLTDEKFFVIGDFCVETLMNDEMKLKIRIEEDCKSWMAPEALRFSFSVKSDVWSLGCVLMEMVSCHWLSDSEVTKLLCDLRCDVLYLEKALESLQDLGGYDSRLCEVLMKMLQINPDERATARELVDIPYVKECLALCGSPLSGQKKTLPLGMADDLQEAGIESTLDFMQIYGEFEDAQIAALKHLSGFMGDEEAFSRRAEIVQLVAQAMRTHLGSMDLQLEGCGVLQDLAIQAVEQGLEEDILTNEALISALLEAMRSFPSSEELLSPICHLLMMVTASEGAVELLGKAGVVSDVLQILRRFTESREICLSCSCALWSLAVSESTRKSVVWEGGVQAVCDVLRVHLEDGELADSICSALWVLSLREAGFESPADCVTGDQHEGVTLILLQAIKTHPERPVLVKNACLALASLLRTSELAAFRLIVPEADCSGITLMKECYRLHSDDPEVVENLALLFSELIVYDDVLPELLSQNVPQMLDEIQVKFASSKEIVCLTETALLKLQQYGKYDAVSTAAETPPSASAIVAPSILPGQKDYSP